MPANRPAGNIGGGNNNFGGGANNNFANRPNNNFANRPSSNDLNSFLGMPTESGAARAGAAGANRTNTMSSTNRPAQQPNRSNTGSKQIGNSTVSWAQGGGAGPNGAYGGRAVAVTGPNGNTYVGGKGGAIGKSGDTVVAKGGSFGAVKTANGDVAGRASGGVVAANNGNVVGRVGGVAGAGTPGGEAVIRGGSASFANGRITGTQQFAAVRNNFGNWNAFSPNWWNNYPNGWRPNHWYPGPWVAAGVAAGWAAASWSDCGSYCGCGSEPIDYSYGDNVYTQDGTVYVDDQPAASAEQYYDGVEATAAAGDVQPAEDEQWMPLGVFSLVAAGQTESDETIQLAVNKDGIIKGNYFNSTANTDLPIQGSVDKAAQRAAFTIGDDKAMIFETGLYNLTKDEANVLIHSSATTNEVRMLVRQKPPEKK